MSGPRARRADGPEEVLAGLAVRHEAYGRRMPLPLYQAARLGNRRERRATPWVLDRGDGTIVATLLCHPLELAVGGRVERAYGLGSVGTLTAHRRRGHAEALCRAACEAGEAEGRPLGLLFASIAPAYYERLGFHVLPAPGSRCRRLADLVASGRAAEIVPIDPRREVERLTAAYRAFHGRTLSVHRDRARFLESVEDTVDDAFFSVRGGEGGYVRLGTEAPETLEVVEAVLLDPADEAPVLRAVARLALDGGRKEIGGWIDPPREAGALFEPATRDPNLPMLRGGGPDPTARLWSSDHF
jgi:hypothetical protein